MDWLSRVHYCPLVLIFFKGISFQRCLLFFSLDLSVRAHISETLQMTGLIIVLYRYILNLAFWCTSLDFKSLQQGKVTLLGNEIFLIISNSSDPSININYHVHKVTCNLNIVIAYYIIKLLVLISINMCVLFLVPLSTKKWWFDFKKRFIVNFKDTPQASLANKLRRLIN